MLSNEAMWIGNQISQLNQDEIGPIVNIGSGTNTFREKNQPYINDFIFSVAESMKIEVIHTDMLKADGVDIVGNIFEKETQQRILALKPRTLIVANILEHVEEREKLAGILSSLLPKEGRIIATVPSSFPYHPAPIDTYFRPKCDELAKLFPAFSVHQAEEIKCSSFISQVLKQPSMLIKMITHIALIWSNYKRAVSAIHRFFWLFKSYKVSCVLLYKAH